MSVARWEVGQVVAVAPKASTYAAAQPLATAARWSSTGCDDRALWGRCSSSTGEPYDVTVDHGALRYRCSCPSRQLPCKHAVALLLLWARGSLVEGVAPAVVREWVERNGPLPDDVRPSNDQPATAAGTTSDRLGGDGGDTPPVAADDAPTPDRSRDERVARMRAGLVELHRWVGDRMRTGLADPAMSQFATWDLLAARLVDAQVGGLANRVRRIAALVGATPDWHARVLAELGLLGLLAEAGLRIADLDDDLADSVAVALGWQVRRADVLAGVPESGTWEVLGRSDTREDRIEVRRVWLRHQQTRRWAMILSVAAYGQALDDSLVVGTTIEADLFRYPGRSRLRALVGPRLGAAHPLAVPPAQGVAESVAEVGAMIAAEPWIDRVPMCFTTHLAGGPGAWYVSDRSGSMLIAADDRAMATLSACLSGGPAVVTAEWTPSGVVPLTVHVADRHGSTVRHVDVGRVAEESFVARR